MVIPAFLQVSEWVKKKSTIFCIHWRNCYCYCRSTSGLMRNTLQYLVSVQANIYAWCAISLMHIFFWVSDTQLSTPIQKLLPEQFVCSNYPKKMSSSWKYFTGNDVIYASSIYSQFFPSGLQRTIVYQSASYCITAATRCDAAFPDLLSNLAWFLLRGPSSDVRTFSARLVARTFRWSAENKYHFQWITAAT